MIQKLKALFNTQTVIKTLISAAIGTVIFLSSQMLITIFIQKESGDILFWEKANYGIHFLSGVISLFIIKQESKGEGIAKAAIVAAIYGLFISGIGIVLFDRIGASVITIILAFLSGGFTCSFIKNALQNEKKTKRRRSINW